MKGIRNVGSEVATRVVRASIRMSELSRFVYIKSHVTLHVKSKAEMVNSNVIIRFCSLITWLNKYGEDGAVEGDFKNSAYLWKIPGIAPACRDTLLSSLQFGHYKEATFGAADNGK